MTTTGEGDTTEIAALDAEVGAGKLARETREGSVTLGGRRLKALRLRVAGCIGPGMFAVEHEELAVRLGVAPAHTTRLAQ